MISSVLLVNLISAKGVPVSKLAYARLSHVPCYKIEAFGVFVRITK